MNNPLNQPKAIKLYKFNDLFNIQLIVSGQGVFMFENKDNSIPCTFAFYNSEKTDGLIVEFRLDGVKVNRIGALYPYTDPLNKLGLSNLNGAFYWFSLDSQNKRFYAGVGEARLDTVVYEYQLENTKDNKLFLESLDHIKVYDNSTSLKPIRLIRDPITTSIPMLVKNTNDLTMDDVASGNYLPKPNLSAMSQKLYDCIGGVKFVLDTDDFPDFSKAIEYSIINPNGWCYKKLQDKSREFNPDKPNLLETYLRITLGENNGESPGIPYVMEIWPIGHYSPIHNHAGAEAVIRVLHGSINVSLFPFLCGSKDGVRNFGNLNFNKDNVTWISPTLNQTHQLKNLDTSTETCITIQCYMYDQENLTHYDYFDYVDDDGNIQQYEPDSDMDFKEFKKQMQLEWSNKLKII